MRIPEFLKNESRIAVIGASGGIGGAFVSALAEAPRIGKIFALSRNPGSHSVDKVHASHIDVLDEPSILRAAEVIGPEPLDLVIVATGILHAGSELQPEKSMRDIDPQQFERVFAVNATGPALVAKHFLPVMRRGSRSVFAAISARVGSIEDNRLGGWVSYRASKAALNMIIRTLSIEHARRNPESILVGLHPGTVDSRLSKPFSSRVPANKLFSPEQSAGHLLKVIDGLVPEDSGRLFAWDGARIPF